MKRSKLTIVRTEFDLRISLEGLGGADTFFGVSLAGCFAPIASLLKNESNRARSSLASLPLRPISTRASRLDSWSGCSRRIAFCVAARAEGDGGRGAGFIACATTSGIVGMLHEDTTGSNGSNPLSKDRVRLTPVSGTHLYNPAQ